MNQDELGDSGDLDIKDYERFHIEDRKEIKFLLEKVSNLEKENSAFKTLADIWEKCAKDINRKFRKLKGCKYIIYDNI